jgi:hypothetical protein
MGIGMEPAISSSLPLSSQHIGMLTACLLSNGKLAIDHVGAVGSSAPVDERGNDRHGVTPLPYRLTLTLFYLHFFFPFIKK